MRILSKMQFRSRVRMSAVIGQDYTTEEEEEFEWGGSDDD